MRRVSSGAPSSRPPQSCKQQPCELRHPTGRSWSMETLSNAERLEIIEQSQQGLTPEERKFLAGARQQPERKRDAVAPVRLCQDTPAEARPASSIQAATYLRLALVTAGCALLALSI